MQELSFLEVGLCFYHFLNIKRLNSYDTEDMLVYGVFLKGTFGLLAINYEFHPCTSSNTHAKGIRSVSSQDQCSWADGSGPLYIPGLRKWFSDSLNRRLWLFSTLLPCSPLPPHLGCYVKHWVWLMMTEITVSIKFKSSAVYLFKKVVFWVLLYISSHMLRLKYPSTITGLYEYCFDSKECL